MYLKSLELQGFKSFPDKVKLEFNKGITAVVGPNGSGKSNIGDAVRWVLGEQSTKTLRGGKMEDVIFSGTQMRKSVGFAQVTLNIDNTSRKLHYDNDLVSVSRKLYRSGESEYIINGQNVRLKDVLELFMDTGLGRDGYSIIGQGKVADIVSSKSNERREIFEEAAGISKFRYKKEEAQRRLNSAQENILRLRDIIFELETRVEPLRIQSEKATKFIALADQKKGLELSVWLYKLNQLKASLNELEENFLIRTTEYENKENEIDDIENAINLAYSNMQKCSVKIEELRNQISEIERRNSQEYANIAVLENDIVHINNLINSYNEKIQLSNTSFQQTAEKIESEKARLEELKSDEIENNKNITDISMQFGALSAQSDEFGKSFAEINSDVNKLYIKKSELNFLINSTSDSIDETKALIEQTASDKEELIHVISTYTKEKAEIIQTQSKIEETLEEHNNKLSGYSKLLERKNSQLENARKEYSDIDIKIRELTQKEHLLTDLENSMEGFAFSVKEVIKAGKSGRIGGIKGSVAQLIKVDSKYGVAIETALGGALQNIIVENEDTAKRCISLLKEMNAGRATFLPITSVKGYTINEKNLDMQEGYVALASELVSFDKAYEGIISSLLGRIVIAEDIDLATAISKRYGYKFKIVTLDGQVINAGGSFTGGSTSRSTGVLTRKNEITSIKEKISSLSETHEQLKTKLSQYQAEVDKLIIDVEAVKEDINHVTSDKIRFDSEFKHITITLDQMEENLESAENSINSAESKLESQLALIEKSKTDLALCEKKITEKELLISQTQNKIESYQDKRELMSEKLSMYKMKQIELSKDIESCEQSIEQLKATVTNTENDFVILNSQIEEQNAIIEQKKVCIEEKKSALESSKSDIESVNILIKEQQKNHQQFEMEANEKRNLQKIMNDEKENLSRELAKVSERKISIQKEYDTIISDMWEQYQLSRSEAASIAVEVEDILVAQKQLNEIKNKIKNLGSVNVAAIEEYKEVSGRYEFMSKQLNDVETSKAELENLIDDLTSNMKEIFTESFNQINNNFKSIFVELFGGGKAELILTDPSNILESGIEINVAPPGKVIKSLSLLSGGEQAFIAIAIYFAILKLRPSPFCILDEIEAALDDVNVAKYAAYLRKFTGTTQFITITHRRGTMEEADVLYGVTMQQKGISKLLKMDNTKDININE